MILPSKRLIAISLTVAFLMLIPFLAMQFSEQVHWTPFDFFIGGALLFGTGLLIDLAIKKVRKTNHRIMLCAAILVALLLVWAELAVGIFGTPFAGS